jgi:hypothetical protein
VDELGRGVLRRDEEIEVAARQLDLLRPRRAEVGAAREDDREVGDVGLLGARAPRVAGERAPFRKGEERRRRLDARRRRHGDEDRLALALRKAVRYVGLLDGDGRGERRRARRECGERRRADRHC